MALALGACSCFEKTYPNAPDATAAGAVAIALGGAVPVSPSLAILWPKAGGAVMGLR